jgi:hypothetical protein
VILFRIAPDDIPRDQLRNRQFPFLSITNHGGRLGQGDTKIEFDLWGTALNRGGYLPTWRLEIELKRPKTFRSHRTTAITTTAFSIPLMDLCIGM